MNRDSIARTRDRPAATSSATAASASARSRWRRCSAARGRGRAAPPAATRSRRRRRTSPPKAKAGHPPVHGRGAEPARPVRLQAGAGEARRQADPAGGHRRPAVRLHPARRGRARPAVQVRQARPVRAPSCRRCCRTWPKVVDDICHRQVGAHRPVQPRPGADLLQHRLRASRAGRAWARGSSTAWAPRRRTCRRSSSCPPAAGISGGRGQLVERLPADRLHRRPVPQPGRPDPQRLQPGGRRRRAPDATRSTWSAS